MKFDIESKQYHTKLTLSRPLKSEQTVTRSKQANFIEEFFNNTMKTVCTVSTISIITVRLSTFDRLNMFLFTQSFYYILADQTK